VSPYSEDLSGHRWTVGVPYVRAWERRLGSSIIDVAVTPNASLIVAGCVNRRVYVFNAAGEEEWAEPAADEVWSVAVTGDGHRIAAGTASKNPTAGVISVFDRHGRAVWQFNVGAPVWSLAFATDGRYLVAGAWNNHVYIFEADGQQYALRKARAIGTAGVYGVDIAAGAERILATAYDDGVYVLDFDLHTVMHYPQSAAGYHGKISADGSNATIGLRGGCAMRIVENVTQVLCPIATRAVCGIATGHDSSLWLAGSFDGTVTLAQGEGIPVWTDIVGSEVWSVAATLDLGTIIVAAGDGILRQIENRVTTTAYREIENIERAVAARTSWADREVATVMLRDCYSRYGLIAYGVHRLEQWRSILGDDISIPTLVGLLLDDVRDHPTHSYSHSRLARHYGERRAWRQCAYHHLQASRDSTLKLVSLTGAGDAFMQMNWHAAAQSCYRRSREQAIDVSQKQVLYNLARSYEDAGQNVEARKHYEVLLTWDPDYRDTWERAIETAHGPALQRLPPDSDYTGFTISLLGPDVPRANEVDSELRSVLNARAKEFSVTTDERRRLYEALAWHFSDGNLVHIPSPVLAYNVAAYMKYDYLLPEDEIKKELELLNLLAVIEGSEVRRSLDIGAATGRHPRTLSRRGVAAFGVDIEVEAMAYARAKTARTCYPQFTVGNGRQLPYREQTFDLVTCMMGTIAHMPRDGQRELCTEVSTVLRPNGWFVLSTWDVDCRHLSFLSMYSHAEREMIRRNSMSRDELAGTLESCGFGSIRIIPFALLPETFSFEWGVQGMQQEHIARILEVDLAARGAYPYIHGEMFMVVARPHSDRA
jgi:SAM-dependent methyltransferase